MPGTVYTFLSVGSSGQNDAAIRTAQGTVSLGQSGVFQPNEYQAVVGRGLNLVAGPAFSPSLSLTAPVVAAGATGLSNGVYKCAVTFVTAAGETQIGPEVTITVASKQILWSSIPLGNVVDGVLTRKLYRTTTGGASGTEKLVATLSDNTTTTFTDNVADGSLGAAAPTSDTAGVIGPMNPQPREILVALLTGVPSDDSFGIGAGTGIKISGGGGSGSVDSVTAGDGTVTVNNTDPANPTVRVTSGQFDASGAAAAVKGIPLGLTGATAATRFVGATASGAPSSGTFLKGDWIVDQTGTFWVCTTAGSPGTWTQVTGGSVTPSSATPIIDGTGAAGTATTYARGDHVHPTDTSRAAVTALPAASSTTPVVDGTAAVGTGTTFARADHVHPTDTTRAPLAPRINTVASSATPAINVSTTDEFTITALAAAITSMTSGLTGSAADGQTLIIRIKDNGTARAITWGTSFVSSGIATLLATTVISKTHTVGLRWDAAASKWVCLAVDATGY